MLADVAEGVRAIVGNRDLGMFTGLGMAQTFTRGALTVFIVVVALDLLHTGEPGVGTLTGAIGAGAVLGSRIASLLVGSRRLAQWFGIGVALWGLPIALIPLFKEIGLLHGVPMFQPLPLPAIEQLARGLEPVHVAGGQAVFARVIQLTASMSSRRVRPMWLVTVAW